MKGRAFWFGFVALLCLVALFWLDENLAHLGPLNFVYYRHIGHLLAVFGFTLLFMQFFLSARFRLVERNMGLDKMLHFHRLFGKIGILFIVGHGLMLLLFNASVGGGLIKPFILFTGGFTLAGFLVTGVLALTYRRWKFPYQLWKNIHVANYGLFPFVLVYHVFINTVRGSLLHVLWIMLGVIFIMIVIHKIVTVIFIRTHPFTVAEVKQEADDIWSLHLTGNVFSYKPGQFMMIQLLRHHTLSDAHPFTISSTPTREGLSLTVKEAGDFTGTIKETRVGDKALIDGPYGVFSFLNTPNEELVFIAGGIGITPFMSMLRYLSDRQPARTVTLFWSNRHESNLCFRTELDHLQQEMEHLTCILVMSRQDDWTGEQGRIDGILLQKYLSSFQGKEYFICGPPEMLRSVVKDLKSLKVPPRHIHYEVFGF